jgi:hypothetical protein
LPALHSGACADGGDRIWFSFWMAKRDSVSWSNCAFNL